MDFWNQADAPESQGEEHGRLSRDAGTNGGFNECESYDEAIKLARYGWKEGVKNFKPVMARIADRLGHLVDKEHMIHDIVGEFPDVSAYLMGSPESMIRLDRRQAPGKGRIVRVVYNCSCSGGVDKKVITARGSVACAMIDAIAGAGYQVELVMSEWAKPGSSGKAVGSVFPLKRSDEPLNLERIAFCLSHPDMLRRMVFAVQETYPQEIRKKYGFSESRGGYGHPADPPEEVHGDIYFGRMHGDEKQWKTQASAEQHAIQMLQDAGIIEVPHGAKALAK